MIELIIMLIIALVSYFGAKKSGATDGEAALLAAAAGAGSYYVTTQTDWGKGLVSDISGWVGLTDAVGTPLTNTDGSVAKAPVGATPVLDASGQVVRDASGNVLWKLIDETGETLQSWGPEGTAGVIATGALAANADNWMMWLGVGAVALVALG